jgi:hypothetical protein
VNGGMVQVTLQWFMDQAETQLLHELTWFMDTSATGNPEALRIRNFGPYLAVNISHVSGNPLVTLLGWQTNRDGRGPVALRSDLIQPPTVSTITPAGADIWPLPLYRGPVNLWVNNGAAVAGLTMNITSLNAAGAYLTFTKLLIAPNTTVTPYFSVLGSTRVQVSNGTGANVTYTFAVIAAEADSL